MSVGIYKIENKLNGNVYIGQSVNIERRWQDHKKRRKDSSSIIGRAFLKHGISNFDFSVIEMCLKDELNDREIHWITHYNSYAKGYNATPGGNSSQSKTGKLTQSKVDSIKLALQGNVLSKTAIANKYKVAESTIRAINEGITWYDDTSSYPIRKGYLLTAKGKVIVNKKVKDDIVHYCKECGTKITKYAKTKMCSVCQRITTRKTKWPDKLELISKLLVLPNTKVCKLYNVSDRTIAVWCKKYNLPSNGSKFKKLKWSAYPESNRELGLRRALVYTVNL